MAKEARLARRHLMLWVNMTLGLTVMYVVTFTMIDGLGDFRNNLNVCEESISRLEGKRGRLQAIVFQSGRKDPRTALFFNTPSSEQSRLAQSLGCQFTR